MTDETHDTSSFENIQPRKLSFKESNDSLIPPMENGNDHQNQSIEIIENQPTDSESTEETSSFHQQTTSTIENQTIDNSNQNSFQFLNNSITEDQADPNQTNPLVIDDQTAEFEEKTIQSKPQRELDEEQIPSAELSTPIGEEMNKSPTSNLENNFIDERPLTALETPYEHHQEKENSFVQPPEDETSLNNQTNQSEDQSFISSSENLPNPMTLSAFLPDVIAETTEQRQNHSIYQSERESTEENPADFTEEDFPPLPQAASQMPHKLNDQDYPPLPSVTLEPDLTTLNNQSTLNEPEDVLGNKTLLKQTIVKGQPNTRPTRSTMVTISYSLSMVDSITSNIRLIERIENEKYFLSENDLISAIDISLQLMDRGEQALIDSDIRHCYGDIGSEEKFLPPITSINPYRMKIELELHDWISPIDIQLLSIDQRLYWGDKKRQMGNFYYRRQDYKTSLQCYRGALRFLDLENNPLPSSLDQTQKSILIDRFIQVENNLAQVYLLLNKYDDCLNAVDNVLKFDSKNLKALFRKGKALFELGNYDQAIQTLKLFIQIQKGNSNSLTDIDKANEMISICENKLANYQKNEKEIYRRMFQPPPSSTTTTTTVDQQHQNKTDKSNQNWLPYVALGSAIVATIGVLTFMKYRKPS